MADPKKYNTGLTESQLDEFFDNVLNKFPARFTENEKKIEENKTDIATVEEQSILNRQTLGTECKNLLENTATTVTRTGITFTVNDDGSVTANGTATALTTLTINAYQVVEQGAYKCSGAINGATDTFFMLFTTYDKDNATAISESTTQTNDAISLDVDGDADSIRAVIQIKLGATVDNVTFYPMIRDARISDATYVPYQPSVAKQLNNKLDVTASAASARTMVRETLTSNADLNTLDMSEGISAPDYKLFVSTTKAVTQTLLNLPPDFPYNGFGLEYIRIAGQQWLQRITGATYSSAGNVTSITVYYRAGVGQQPDVTWGGWFMLAPTACTTTEV